jgi:hypothetical protein
MGEAALARRKGSISLRCNSFRSARGKAPLRSCRPQANLEFQPDFSVGLFFNQLQGSATPLLG